MIKEKYSKELISFVNCTIFDAQDGLNKIDLETAREDIEEWKNEGYEDLPEDLTPENYMTLWNELCDEENEKQKGIYINEKETPFIDRILEGKKTGETRKKDMLKGMFPEDTGFIENVALISTGKGKAMIKGYATVVKGIKYSREQIVNLADQLQINGTAYEASEGGKWVYWLFDVRKCDPQQMPKNVIKHGRSWCEF